MGKLISDIYLEKITQDNLCLLDVKLKQDPLKVNIKNQVLIKRRVLQNSTFIDVVLEFVNGILYDNQSNEVLKLMIFSNILVNLNKNSIIHVFNNKIDINEQPLPNLTIFTLNTIRVIPYGYIPIRRTDTTFNITTQPDNRKSFVYHKQKAI